MRHALFVAFALFAATSASALEPATAAYLTKQGYDPQSEEITRISQDVITAKDGTAYSLDTLAADGDKTGTRAFVTTRNFIKAYMKDTKTPFPKREVYQTVYLKPNEVSFILAALKKSFKLA
jgi:hypothetical protein